MIVDEKGNQSTYWLVSTDFGTGGGLINTFEEQLRYLQSALPANCGATAALLDGLPRWFRELGTDVGVATFEKQTGRRMGASLRLFYQYPATCCWVGAHNVDVDVLLESYCPDELPRVLRWCNRAYMVLWEYPRGQCVCALELDTETPRMEYGYDTEPFDISAGDSFTEWLTGFAQNLVDSPDTAKRCIRH